MMVGFGKTCRLLKKHEFDRVFENAKKLTTPYFVILYRENAVGRARLGMALSKKHVPKAHDRNRLKRMVRETFRVRTTLAAVDVVVLAKFGAGQVQNSVICNALDKAWDKLDRSYDK